MANALTPMSPTYWSKIMGRKRYKTEVFKSIASFEEQAVLTDGQIVDRPYRSDVVAESYTKGTALTAQDLTATSNQLTVNQFKGLLMYVDNVDKIQNKWSAAKVWAEEAQVRLSNLTDAYVLYEVVNANNTVDDGTLGGTSGNGITVTVNNILNIFGKINRKLTVQNIPMDQRFFVISAEFYDVLWQYIAGKASLLGDKTGETGNVGTFASLLLYVSNNLTGQATLTSSTAAVPTATQTVTINGVVFTWQTTIGTTAGNVLAVTDRVTSLGNLKDLINNGGVGDGVNNVSLSLANQRIVQNWVATVSGTGASCVLLVSAKGASYMTVSTTDVGGTWTAALQNQLLFAGHKGCVDVVIQQNPTVEMASTVAAGKSGMNILPLTVFGTKTFNQGKNEMVKVPVRSDAY